MIPGTKLMTAEELLKMPDDGFRHELIDGQLKRMPLAGHYHGRIVVCMTVPLGNHVEENDLGDMFAAGTGFLLKRNPDLVRAPNAAFVREERVEEVGDTEGFFPGAPDLAVEVVSPGDTAFEVEDKVETWLKYGTRAVWVLYPKARSVNVHRSCNQVRRLTEDDTLDGEDVVPGFGYPVKKLFDR